MGRSYSSSDKFQGVNHAAFEWFGRQKTKGGESGLIPQRAVHFDYG